MRTSRCERGRFSFLTFPAVSRERVWVQAARSLAALDPKSGSPLWVASDFGASRDELPGDNQNPRTGGFYASAGRALQAAPSVEGSLVVTRIPLSEGGSAAAYPWPRGFAIAAFDSRTGRPLWRSTLGPEQRYYFNLPTLHANAVLTGIAAYRGGITEYTATALDAGTGEPLWSTYLGAGSDPLIHGDGSPALVQDGTVWIESSLYTLNALDLLTGEVLAVYHYHPSRRGGARSGIDSSPYIPAEPISLVAACRSAGGETPDSVAFAQRWGERAVGFEAAPGRLRWDSLKKLREDVNKRDVEAWRAVKTKADWEKMRDVRIARLQA